MERLLVRRPGSRSVTGHTYGFMLARPTAKMKALVAGDREHTVGRDEHQLDRRRRDCRIRRDSGRLSTWIGGLCVGTIWAVSGAKGVAGGDTLEFVPTEKSKPGDCRLAEFR